LSDLNNIVRNSREFFNTGVTKDVVFRKNQLKLLKKAILENEEEILSALKKDLNKPQLESYATEVGLVIKEIDLFIKRIESWSEPKKVKTSLMHFWSQSYVYKDPYGVVLIFAPWNYPFQLLMLPLVGALAAGNTAVLKPSEFAPATANIMVKLIEDNFSKEYISIVQGDVKVSQALLKERFDYIFFTGSKNVGKAVMRAAANNLTPVTLELGGKSPCIINKDADIDLSAKRVIWGKFMNAGQICVAPDYLYLHESIKEEFIEKAKKYIEEFYGDNPQVSSDYCRIINENHFERLMGLLNEGEIILGGKSDKNDLYIEPTIIDKISWDDPIMKEEIFGPILPIIEFEDIENIIDDIRNRPKPLALYIFSESIEIQKLILNQLSFGGGCINDTIIHVSSAYLPFGGVGESGMGVYHGRSSFDTFTHEKSIIKKTTKFDLDLRYPPYKNKLTWVKRFFNWF
jgi:aldehyde dehydrogenase (NAD+)